MFSKCIGVAFGFEEFVDKDEVVLIGYVTFVDNMLFINPFFDKKNSVPL